LPSLGAPEPERVLHRFVQWVHDQPELVRIAITAAIGTVLAWVTYEMVYALNGLEPRATTSWAIAFTIGIFRQHHLHRTLSFPAVRLNYGISLGREVLASLVIITASAVLNYTLTIVADLHHRLAWVVCLVSVATLEYALMKLFVFRSRRSGARS
jgi:putative flippase GtrA